MTTIQIVLGILLGVISVALIAVVLMQPGKDKRLSGAIAGGSETYFGQGKTARKEKTLNTITVALCLAMFVLLVVFVCIGGATA